MMMRRYLIVLLGIFLALAMLLAGFNWLMNPYAFFASPLIEGVNVIKPEIGFHERKLKAYKVSQLKPAGVVLGNSRSDVGLSPTHPSWSVQPTYNLGIGQASTYTVLRYYRHANYYQPLNEVVLGLGLEMFSAAPDKAPPDRGLALAVNANGSRDPNFFGRIAFQGLTSVDILQDAIGVFRVNRASRGTDEAAKFTPAIGPDGRMSPDSFRAGKWMTRQAAFHSSLKAFVDTWWSPLEHFRNFTGDDDESVRYFRMFLADAYASNQDVKIVFSPTHAYLNEAMAAAGMWEAHENWKRMIVRVVEEEALKAQRDPFKTWDFWGYSTVTTEEVPRQLARLNDMVGYWDPSHYKSAVGDMILDRVFAEDRESQADGNFGYPLTAENVEERIAEVRLDRQRYRGAHRAEVAEIEAIVQGYLAK